MAGNYYKRAANLGQDEAKVNLAVLLMEGDNQHANTSGENLDESQNTVVMEMSRTKETQLGHTPPIGQSWMNRLL